MSGFNTADRHYHTECENCTLWNARWNPSLWERKWQSKCDRVDKKCDNLWSASHFWTRTRGGLDSSQPTGAFIMGHICHETHGQVPHFSSDTFFMWHNWHAAHNDTIFICPVNVWLFWYRSDWCSSLHWKLQNCEIDGLLGLDEAITWEESCSLQSN